MLQKAAFWLYNLSVKKRCIIVGAGEFVPELFEKNEDDYVIAADGGYEYLKRCSAKPDLVIGDFDSLGRIPSGENVEVFPQRKDDTDLMLAAKRAVGRYMDPIVIHGALGNRTDHSFAAVQTLCFIARSNLHGFLIGKPFTMSVIQHGALEFDSSYDGMISVFALEKCSGVTIHGLEYCLDEAGLDIDCPVGVSNAFTGKEASVSVKDGLLLVLWESRSIQLPRFVDFD